MSTMSTIDRTVSTGAVSPAVTAQRSVVRDSRRAYAGLIGALFLAAIVLYGVGNGLVMSVVGVPDFLATVSAHQITVALGALLMLLNSLAVVGLGVLFFPILEPFGKRTALAYLAARIVEAVLLAVGVVWLLMIVPLGQHGAGAGAASDGARALWSLAIQANALSYQIAMMALGLGSIVLCALLIRTRLIPRFLSVWGLIGYAIFLAGAIAEIVGIHIGVLLSIPGGLFELMLGGWLLVRGFRAEADGQEA